MAQDFDRAKQQVKDRSDIVDIIGSHVKLKKNGPNFLGLCPFHNEKSPSFNVNQNNQFYHCFGCGKSGDVFNFVQDYEQLDFRDALEKLASRANVILPEWGKGQSPEERIKQRNEKEALYDVLDKATNFFHQQLLLPQGADALKYTQGRGLDQQVINSYRLGYAPNSWDALMKWANQHNFSAELLATAGLTKHNEKGKTYDRFRNRLMFPIHDISGRVIAFSARVLEKDDKAAKYINSPETPVFHKGNVLYGIHIAHKHLKESEHFVICEGQLDVIACHRAGVKNAIAAQGTAFTDQHASMIARYAKHVKLCFDADAAGKKAAVKCLNVLLPKGVIPEIISLDEGEDPDTVLKQQGPEVLKEKLSGGINFVDFILSDYGPSSPTQDKVKISEFLLDILSKLPNVLMGDWHLRLASKLQLDAQAISEQLRYLVYNKRDHSQYTKPQTELQQAPQKVAPPPLNLNKISKRAIAEIELITLALSKETFANLVFENTMDIKPETSAASMALHFVNSHIEMGNWRDCKHDLEASFPSIYELVLRQGNISSYHKREAEGNDYEALLQLVDDCVKQINKASIEQNCEEVKMRLLSEEDPEKKQELFKEYMSLNQELKNA
ncbi:DNA primase [Lentisphaera profundi]|uniref:DNA primase n=1 Tax=Lentisphaera profundi TaxID=1658616 RepID=A0ABY7VP07_9BACT|nr:DNA primase [Lentisphaera profundi]WDE95521.1 DNA primase [Lentisphaera profundi]